MSCESSLYEPPPFESLFGPCQDKRFEPWGDRPSFENGSYGSDNYNPWAFQQSGGHLPLFNPFAQQYTAPVSNNGSWLAPISSVFAVVAEAEAEAEKAEAEAEAGAESTIGGGKPYDYGLNTVRVLRGPAISSTRRKRDPFFCQRCRRLFSTSTNLTRHNSTSMCAVKSGLTNGPAFNCTVCRKTYNRRDNLNKHVKDKHPPIPYF